MHSIFDEGEFAYRLKNATPNLSAVAKAECYKNLYFYFPFKNYKYILIAMSGNSNSCSETCALNEIYVEVNCHKNVLVQVSTLTIFRSVYKPIY